MKKLTAFACILAIFYSSPIAKRAQRIFTVVLDPAGDAKRTGRRIGDSFERGLTLQCAEKIKEVIEKTCENIKVIITRVPGDIIYDLQNASLSNRIGADLFVNINFYATHDSKPTIFVYRFCGDNDFALCNQELAFHSYDQAYRINKHITNELSCAFYEALSQQQYQSQFIVSRVFALPIKPLIGILAPAISVEAGLKGKELWINYVDPLVHSIIAALNRLE